MAIDPQILTQVAPGPGGPNLIELETPFYWQPSKSQDEFHQDLAIAIRAMALKRPDLDRRWSYYKGHHDEKILSEKLRQVIRRHPQVTTMFTNYCRLAVEAPLSRLEITGWKGKDAVTAQDLWDDNDLDLEAEEIHRQALVAGEAFVIVWPRIPNPDDLLAPPDAGPTLDIAVQDARNCHLQYGARRRRAQLWGCKVYLDNEVPEPIWRAILYYPTEIIRLRTEPNLPQPPLDADVFYVDGDDPGGPHTLGMVPMVRIARYFDGDSRMDDVVPIQDRINKLTADKVIAGEFGAFPQRWVLSNDDPPDAVLRAGPGSVWVMSPSSVNPEGGEEARTQVGQFPTTELSNYDGTIQREVNALFTVAQLPRHLLVDPGVAPTGEAIKADEGPFVTTVRGYQRVLQAAWVDLMKLCGLADAMPVWKDIEAHNELTSAQTFQTLCMAGMPLAMAAEIAMDLPQEQLDELAKLPVLPQPGAGLPGQSEQPPPPAEPKPAPAPGARPGASG